MFGMTVLILSMLVIACGDDGAGGGGKEFYAVYYHISNETQTTLDSSHKYNFSTATLTFVKKADGSTLVGEKRGTAEEVVAFLNGLSLSPSLSSVMPIPTATQIEAQNVKVGAISGWWPSYANPKYFVYIERAK